MIETLLSFAVATNKDPLLYCCNSLGLSQQQCMLNFSTGIKHKSHITQEEICNCFYQGKRMQAYASLPFYLLQRFGGKVYDAYQGIVFFGNHIQEPAASSISMPAGEIPAGHFVPK
jgi:hypothetical protein